ncbi:hypothetical protein [Mycolicibacterium hippocampi]|uniref:Uncharacterized protein n=1 Tax=Mycolicibacterium hippocampi TaxID=659824 RepID=A0A7I9ZIV9_9MYCO|nr:hypothetical protein [Mycolicibacterium hippocampi]GFH00962.1 hypothetical protein MHIP_14450 [Mycolicibacterium hippocampi]
MAWDPSEILSSLAQKGLSSRRVAAATASGYVIGLVPEAFLDYVPDLGPEDMGTAGGLAGFVIYVLTTTQTESRARRQLLQACLRGGWQEFAFELKRNGRGDLADKLRAILQMYRRDLISRRDLGFELRRIQREFLSGQRDDVNDEE